MCLSMLRSNRSGLVIAGLLLLGLVQLADAATIKAKAWLAPVLIERAWEQSQTAGVLGVKPWAWADTFPVARLRVPALDQNLLVLAGDSGNALAFGPGHTLASAALGDDGVSVIGGHRDTHFSFLRDLQPGSEVSLETVDGVIRRYQISGRKIVDSAKGPMMAGGTNSSLLLVTCYPFDAIFPGGSLRYVVKASLIES